MLHLTYEALLALPPETPLWILVYDVLRYDAVLIGVDVVHEGVVLLQMEADTIASIKKEPLTDATRRYTVAIVEAAYAGEWMFCEHPEAENPASLLFAELEKMKICRRNEHGDTGIGRFCVKGSFCTTA